MIKQLKDFGVFYIYFLGGEPFIRQDFLEILDFCSSFGLGIMISTNGWFITSEIAKRIAAAKVSLIRVSIDGAKAETHDKHRGKNGSFRQAWEAVSILKSQHIPLVGVSLTVMEENYHEVEELIELAIKKEIKELQLVQLCRTGRGAKVQGLTIEHLRKLRRNLVSNANYYRKHLKFSTTEGILQKAATTAFCQKQKLPLMMGCTAGRASIAISADGKVMPCIQFRKVAGDLRHRSLSDIWKNSSVLQERRIIKPECENCQFNSICARECPADPVDGAERSRRLFVRQHNFGKSCSSEKCLDIIDLWKIRKGGET